MTNRKSLIVINTMLSVLYHNELNEYKTVCNSPSLLFDVTNIMSGHCGCSHVANESKELIT